MLDKKQICETFVIFSDNRVLNQSEMETRRRRDDYEMRSQMTESSPTAVARHLDAVSRIF